MGKRLPFNEWKAELHEIVRVQMNTELEEITDVDEDTMSEYWKDGNSPREFFKEHVVSAVDAPTDDFDFRYEV